MKKKPFIPFGMWPMAWGLKGESRQIAQAEYELSGEDLERRKSEIKWRNDEKAFHRHSLGIDLKYGKISKPEFDLKLAEFNQNPEDILAAKLKHNKISQKEFDKETATLKGEPWVDIASVDFSKTKPSEGSLSLDWNDVFVKMLSDAGYIGKTDEETVDLWLTDLCKNIALEALDGVGEFNDNLEEASYLKRTKIDDNRSEIR